MFFLRLKDRERDLVSPESYLLVFRLPLLLVELNCHRTELRWEGERRRGREGGGDREMERGRGREEYGGGEGGGGKGEGDDKKEGKVEEMSEGG